MPRGCTSARVRRKFGILFRPWNFIRQARDCTANRNYSRPYVRRSPPFMRYAYREPTARQLDHRSRIPFLQIILPLSLIRHCFGRTTLCVAEHNELFRPVLPPSTPSRSPPPTFSSRFSRAGRCIRRFIYGGQLIFQSELSRASRARQGENDDANRDEFAHTDTKGLLPNNGYTQSVFTPAEFELGAFSSKK